MDIPEKYHRGYVTVNLDTVYDNIKQLKSNCRPGTNIIAVVKADGYGHGAVPIARKIDGLVSAYAVATIEEAVNLRNHKIDKPIYIIGYTHISQFHRLIENECRCTIFDALSAKKLSEKAVELGRKAHVHIKVDTGMSRIGFKDNEESVNTVLDISKMANIDIEGIFTHFYAADEADKTSARNQFQRFTGFIDKLEQKGLYIPVKHCSNSAAIMEMDDVNLGNVRAGIAMYGLMPSNEVDTKSVSINPALEWKSHVIFVKDIQKGTGVSYGATYVADSARRVATIPIGYGDGYSRSLSGKGFVLIHGQRAPILGRICMDQFMVDVTDIPDVGIDDEVTLIGRDGDEVITAQEIGEMAGSFNYEVVCDIGKRIPRVYIEDNKIISVKDYFSDTY